MRDFHSIIEYLKNYLQKPVSTKILDKDVAKALEIGQSNFATIKKRNATPYEKILRFCQKEQLCCRELFFENDI